MVRISGGLRLLRWFKTFYPNTVQKTKPFKIFKPPKIPKFTEEKRLAPDYTGTQKVVLILGGLGLLRWFKTFTPIQSKKQNHLKIFKPPKRPKFTEGKKLAPDYAGTQKVV